ncbi:MAG: lysophospholipid acyltransferase family protein [Planctomycetia bacterium]|nr:lysophospholipid acyltransferase family protein [Planctomycetia bacterium]
MKKTWFQRAYYTFWCNLIRLWAKIWFRISYRHWERVPRTGAVILIANHQSFLDPPLIGIGLTRYCHFMARKTLFRGLFGWHLRNLNAFPISQDGNPIGGIKETLRLLKQGEAVVIFPEGSRSFDGKLQPFQGGILTVAKRAKVPIVPCAIRGAYEALPRGSKFPKPRKIIVTYGQPIPVEEIQKMSETELLEQLTQKVRNLFNSIELR